VSTLAVTLYRHYTAEHHDKTFHRWVGATVLVLSAALGYAFLFHKVRTMPHWPRSWINFSTL
jgi:hypothetical protein